MGRYDFASIFPEWALSGKVYITLSIVLYERERDFIQKIRESGNSIIDVFSHICQLINSSKFASHEVLKDQLKGDALFLAKTIARSKDLVNQVGSDERTALLSFCRNRRLEKDFVNDIVRELACTPEVINYKPSESSYSPLMFAVKNKNHLVVDALLHHSPVSTHINFAAKRLQRNGSLETVLETAERMASEEASGDNAKEVFRLISERLKEISSPAGVAVAPTSGVPAQAGAEAARSLL